GAVAQHGRRLPPEAGQDELAFFDPTPPLAGLWVDDLHVEVVLEDVKPVVLVAFDPHARAAQLGKAVDVEGLQAKAVFDLAAHAFAPGLGAEEAAAKLELYPRLLLGQ